MNCRHYPMNFIPGFSTIKGEPQDPEENEKEYAESQEQRRLERKLREEKRDLEVLKAQGADEAAIKAQKEKVKQASADIDQFCEDTGMARRRNRESAPTRATWPGQNGEVTRYDGEYMRVNDVPPPKGLTKKAQSGKVSLPKKLPQADNETLPVTLGVDTPIIHGIVPYGSEITNIFIIAGSGTSATLRDAPRLAAQYSKPADSWQKKSGMVTGAGFKYEIHWYASGETAPTEDYKLKGVMDR